MYALINTGFGKLIINNARGGKPPKYPFREMKIDSYFKAGPFRPGTDEVENTAKRLRSAAYAAEKLMEGKKFSVRKNVLVGGMVEIIVGRWR